MAQHHEDGMDNAHRQLQEGMRFNPDDRAGTEALHSYLRAIIAVFDSQYQDHQGAFSANLTVPSADATKLWLVLIEPGGGGRSNPLPRPIEISDESWGAVVAYRTGNIVYTPDVTQEHNHSGNRGYLSVVNLPVLDSQGKMSAVVNIDSPQRQAFESQESVKAAADYCRPIISSLSLCLSDPRLFKKERC